MGTRISCLSVCWVVSVSLSSFGIRAASPQVVESVKDRDAAALRAALKQGADVNTLQPDGATALHWAAHWNDLEAADLLIRAGARVNVANSYGATPLWLACEHANSAMVETLLKAGANPNASLPTGETPLMTAARTGNADAIRALLAHGADVNAAEASQGQTALMWTVSQGHVEVARTLIERGANVRARTKAGFTPLLFAARQGDLDMVRMLLANGADINETASDGHSALLVATVRGQAPVATFLLDQGAAPDADAAGYTALHWATGTWEVQLTGPFGITPPPGSEWSALGGLQGETQLDVIKALLARGANPNARITRKPPTFGNGGFAMNLVGATPFVVAASVANIPAMRLLQATFQIHQSTAGLLRKLGGTGSPRARQDLVTPVK